MARWKEAFDSRGEFGDSIVPKVLLGATNIEALKVEKYPVSLDDLKQFQATPQAAEASMGSVSFDHSHLKKLLTAIKGWWGTVNYYHNVFQNHHFGPISCLSEFESDNITISDSGVEISKARLTILSTLFCNTSEELRTNWR